MRGEDEVLDISCSFEGNILNSKHLVHFLLHNQHRLAELTGIQEVTCFLCEPVGQVDPLELVHLEPKIVSEVLFAEL